MRVLVQQPAIFILDEATASIDPFTEWQIQQALNLILEHTTSILIAHRLSTVRAADRIIVMENGRIIQEGTHDGLLEQGGHYAMLYNTYFRHQSLAYVEEQKRLRVEDSIVLDWRSHCLRRTWHPCLCGLDPLCATHLCPLLQKSLLLQISKRRLILL